MYDNSAKNANQTVMFWIFDGRISILLLLFLLSFSLKMLFIIFATMMFFYFLNWSNITPEMFLRMIKRKIMCSNQLLARNPTTPVGVVPMIILAMFIVFLIARKIV